MTINNNDHPMHAFAIHLLGVAIRIVAVAQPQLLDLDVRHPSAVAVRLLCRTISNFQAALKLLDEKMIVEARALLRCCYENLIFIGALKSDGVKFVEALLKDDAASKRNRAKFLLNRSQSKGLNLGFEEHLAPFIQRLEETHPQAKLINAKATAEGSVLSDAYVYFAELSADGTHATWAALDRYIQKDESGNTCTITYNPEASQAEIEEALLFACNALLGACVGLTDVAQLSPAVPLRKEWNEFCALRDKQLKAAS